MRLCAVKFPVWATEVRRRNIADISNGLTASPNLIALLALSGVVAKETGIFPAVRSFLKVLL